MRRRRHGLDLLPLLDVFMVVLFVFATIQEQQLGASAQASAALQAELEALRERDDAAALERLKQQHAAAEQVSAQALAQARAEQAQLREALTQVRRAAEQAAATASLGGDEALRRQAVLTKLLDHFSVFEIEIDGELAGDAIVNHCCYRTELLEGPWRACGRIPEGADELREWLAGGGGGLLDALRRTRGGNALTVVRQSERATWGLGRKLEDELKARFADHKIYTEAAAPHAMACAR